MKKRMFSLVLVLALCMGLCVPALAYGDTGIAKQASTLTCGYNCVAVIDNNNTLWMWGDGGDGIFGGTPVGEDSFYTTPQKVMDNVSSVSISSSSTTPYIAVIKTDGSLWTWGHNGNGQLGNGGKGKDFNGWSIFQETPLKIMDDVTAVSCAIIHAAAIKTDGSLWAWGNTSYGRVGNGCEDGLQTTPVKIMDGVAVASCGKDYTAAVKTDGTLWMWGNTSLNRFNNGSKSNYVHQHEYVPERSYSCQTVPVKVLDSVASVYCGVDIENPFVLQTDGTLVTWPQYTEMIPYSENGVPMGERPAPPQEPLPLQVIAQDVISVTDGPDYPLSTNNVAYIKKDGSLWIYGENRFCQLGDPEKVNVSYTTYKNPTKVMDNAVSVAVCGFNAVIAMKPDGSLWMWGAVDNIGNGVAGNYDRSMRDSTGSLFSVKCQSIPLRVTNITAKVSNANNSSIPSISTVGGFVDIKSSDYFADAVLWAVERSITSGTSKTTFSPNATCSKAQILTFLWHANGSPEPTAANPFIDIKTSNYFYKAALWAAEKGLVSGSTFGANTDCTRAMTVEYLWKAAGSPTPSANASFTDIPTNADYAQAVAWAVENKITSGTGGGNFSPNATCTRGQIVTFLYRAMGK